MTSETPPSTQCAICHISAAKYTCPACSLRTCSVPCIKQHKTKTLCTGLIAPSTFIPAKALATPESLNRDYNFLTGIERKLGKEEGADQDEDRAGKLATLWKAREVDVRRAPRGMKRRAEDESRVENSGNGKNNKRARIVWSIEWVVGGERRMEMIPEGTMLVDAFRKLEPRPAKAPAKGEEKFYLRKPFVAAPPGTVVVETVDGRVPFKEVLRGKSIDTFPTVHVYPESVTELEGIVVDDDGKYQDKVLKDWKIRLGVEEEGEITDEGEVQEDDTPAKKPESKEDTWGVVDKALFSALERDMAREASNIIK